MKTCINAIQYFLLLFFFSVHNSSEAQKNLGLPKKVSDYVQEKKIKPLKDVDSLTRGLPVNFTTNSGWHIDYYAEKGRRDFKFLQECGDSCLNYLWVYQLIYNDSLFYGMIMLRDYLNQLSYDSIVMETPAFIYFKTFKPAVKNNLYVISKMKAQYFQFSHVLKEDFENNIFIERSNVHSQNELFGALKLEVTNLNTNERKEIKFKNLPFGADDKNPCGIEKVVYTPGDYGRGKLRIEAKVVKIKRRFKIKTEIKVIEI